MIFNLYKNRGETPLECIQRFRKAHPEYKDDKWTYLGRLDPMAEGVLLAATGEDIAKKEEFLNLDKDYDFTAIFGFATDSYDILGRILRVERVEEKDLTESKLLRMIKIFEGEREQKYPPFSSKTVRGTALHEWSRRGEIDDVEIPTRPVTIYKIGFQGLSKLSPKELLGRLLMDISKIKGDFRQHETLQLWRQMLSGYGAGQLFIGRFSTHVSSGTYVRGIVNDLGNTLGLGACALSITRTRVGEYKIEDSLK